MNRTLFASALAASLIVCTACSTLGLEDESEDKVIRRVRDFNGDGIDDLAIGALNNGASAPEGGAVYIHFGGGGGGPERSAGPNTVLRGTVENGMLGASLTRAGDLNGDGLADLIVGAPGAAAGRAYVYFGSRGDAFDATPDGVLGADLPIVSFGSSVAGAGDFNCDGYGDVIVGAPGDNAAGSGAGSARIYFGGPGATFDTTADVVMYGQEEDNFGWAVAGVGDFNGDRCEDILVSSPFKGAGAARLYLGGRLGSQEFNAVADAEFKGEAFGDRFGRAIAGAGDLNGDGLSDLAIAAPYHDAWNAETESSVVDAGRVYFYFGNRARSRSTVTLSVAASSAAATISGHRPDEHLGFAVAIVGDLNGDKFADAVVTAPEVEEQGNRRGEARILYGDKDFSAEFSVIVGNAERFGETVGAAGDFNHDGFADLILTSPNANFVPGAAVYYGSKRSIDPYPDVMIRSPNDEWIVVR